MNKIKLRSGIYFNRYKNFHSKQSLFISYEKISSRLITIEVKFENSLVKINSSFNRLYLFVKFITREIRDDNIKLNPHRTDRHPLRNETRYFSDTRSQRLERSENWESSGKPAVLNKVGRREHREREREKRRKKRRRRRREKGRFTFLCTRGGSSPRVSLAARTTQWGINSRDGNALYVCSFPQFAGNSLHPSRRLSTDSYLISEMIISEGSEILSVFSPRKWRRRKESVNFFLFFLISSFIYYIKYVCNSTVLRCHKLVNSLRVARELPLICR